MPNWCYNRTTFSHVDPKQIDLIVNILHDEVNGGNGLLQSLLPCPMELLDTIPHEVNGDVRREANLEKYGFPDWYEWRVANWGTKWDLSVDDTGPERKSPTEVYLEYETAWAPPLAAYAKLKEMGYTIESEYCEPDMEFAGSWNDGTQTNQDVWEEFKDETLE